MSRLNLILLIILIILGVLFVYTGAKHKNLNPKKPTPVSNNIKPMPEQKIIREPAVAGQFYPADPSELNQMIDGFLANVKMRNKNNKTPDDETQNDDKMQINETQDLASLPSLPSLSEQTPRILIVPHAGYIFSGATAAYGFKTLADHSYDTIIILGPSHHFAINKLTLYTGDTVKTPLGEININKKLTAALVSANNSIEIDNAVHAPEHSLEVEIPFLQKVLKNNFQLVLGLTNIEDLDTLDSIAQSLKTLINQKTLIVISSDLAHYPNYSDAIYSDTKIIDSILTKNARQFTHTINSILDEHRPGLETCACGNSALKIGMLLADKLNLIGEKLHYSNSGDTPNYGDKNRVVGYGAVVFWDNKSNQEDGENKKNTLNKYLNEKEKQIALKLARNTLELEFNLTNKKFGDYKNYPIFNEKRGVFVTLTINNQLRGCIGLIEPLKELDAGIIEMSRAAAFNDSRFNPLTATEFKRTKIEISVLTPPEKISDPEKQIKLGQHGVIVRQGQHSGVFLPQVATDTGWNLEEFMAQLCAQKAGLSPDCWKNKDTDIYTFEAQVFGEDR